MIKVLLRCVKQYKKSAILTPVFTGLVVLMETIVTYVTASIVDKGIVAGNLGAVIGYGAIMIVLACFGLYFGIQGGRYAAYSSSGFGANLREAMYANIQKFSFTDIDKFSTPSLVTRMTTDVSNIQNAFQMLMRISTRAPLTIIFSMFMCFAINMKVSIIFLVAIVILTVSLYFIISRSMALFSEMMKKYDELNGLVRENVAGIRVVKSFVRENHESLKFRLAVDLIYKISVKAEVLMNLNGPVMNLVTYGSMIALSWFGANFIVSGELTTGQLTSLFSYVMAILVSLMILSMVVVFLTISIASAKRVAEVISHVPSMHQDDDAVCSVRNGSISFENVNFSYTHGGDPVLKNINLQIESGETIGIIGGTGCGKSTLVALISRLYDVTKGSVRVGGVDVRSYDMDTLRENVAVVLQKNVLFSGTILDNLRWGKNDATLEECQDACRKACADDFIEAFPEKYNTVIEQGGTNVSGGQKQRLCIARALLKSPKILILDDSTSAVDTATDARIRETFRTQLSGVTTLIISQRILSVKDADRIIVMNDGEVIGFDKHENLLQSNSIYKEIYDMQTSGGEADFDK